MRASRFKFILYLTSALLLQLLPALPAASAEVVLVGDITLQPVVTIISGIRETLNAPLKVYSPAEARGRLTGIVAEEGAKTVIALGKDAINDALQLPPSVAVIYDMVILPPRTNRPNTTGLYMATPVAEYMNVIKKYLPSLRRVSVVSSQEIIRTLGGAAHAQVAAYQVNSSLDLINTVKELDEADAFLLLPDVPLLTSTALEEIYLFSFRKNVPILGISEKHVKQGSLFALVFDPASVGRMIGEKALEAVNGEDMGRTPPAPSRTFSLYINTDTAKKMGVAIPAELLRKAKAVYP